MKSIIYTLFVLLISFSYTNAQNLDGELKFSIDDIIGCEGDSVCLQLKVENFNQIQGIGFVMSYDPSVLKFLSIETDDTVLDGVNFNTNSAVKDGWFLILWTDLEGESVTLADGTVILEICVEFIGEAGSHTNMVLIDGKDTYFIDTVVPGEQDIVYTSANVDVTSCTEFDILLDWCSPSIGNSDGVLTVSACCGNAPYAFNIPTLIGLNSIANNKDELIFNNIPPGIYTIEMRDLDGNIKFKTFEVKNTPVMEALPFEVKNPTCWNKKNGKLILNGIGGGEEPYKLAWSTGEYTSNVLGVDATKIQYLASGRYGVTISDVNGCEISMDTMIFKDTIYAAAILIDSASCQGVNDGQIEITGSRGDLANGVGYYFNEEVFSAPTISKVIMDAHSGWNEYKVSGDPKNCYSVIDSIFVPYKKELHFNPTQFGDVQCHGGTTEIKMDIVNVDRVNVFHFVNTVTGVENLDGYHGNKDIIIPNVHAGTYHIEVNESMSGCQADTTIVINEPDSLYMLVTTETQPTCFGNDGVIVVDGRGGVPGYTYSWNGGATGSSRSNLGGGTHIVSIEDSNGCIETLNFVFLDAATFEVEIDTLQTIDCTNPNSGSLGVNVLSGGSGSFHYEWSTGVGSYDTGAVISNLVPDTYFLKAIDDIDGCVAFDTITLIGSSTMEIDSTVSIPTCFNSEDGTLSLVINGGATPYIIDWEGYPANKDLQVLSNIGQGIYQVTIADQVGCTVVRMLELPAPDTIKVTVDNIEDTHCFGQNSGKAFATGNNGNNGNSYNFVWSSSPDDGANNTASNQASHLYGGNQWVIVADSNCASDTMFFIVNEPVPITISSLDIVAPSCAGNCDGSITILGIEGGSPSYLYDWGSGNIANGINNICEGSHSLTILDANNCMLDTVFNIVEPEEFIVTIDSANTQPISCQDTNSGIIKVKYSGGNSGTNTYQWTNNVSTEDLASGLGIGTYFITVTDLKGCFDTTKWTLVPPSPVIATLASVADIECYGDETCIGIDAVTGGVGNYSFSINNSPNFSIDSCISVSAGEYNILVFDNAGCFYEEVIVVTQPDEIILEISPEDNVFELGDDPKILNLTISNNTSPIDNIEWTPNTALDCLDTDCLQVGVAPIANITYQVVVTDENGCIAKASKDILVESNRNVYFPNVFKPESDDLENSLFNFSLGNGVEKLDYFYIFDRWGSMIYERKNILPGNEPDAAWDGTYKGRMLEPGVFVYIAAVSFIDDKVIEYKGSITIVR